MHASRCNGVLFSVPTPYSLTCLLLVILLIFVFVVVVLLLLPTCPSGATSPDLARAIFCTESRVKHEDIFFPDEEASMNRPRARSLLRGATSRRYETRQAEDWKNHVDTCACTMSCLKQLDSAHCLGSCLGPEYPLHPREHSNCHLPNVASLTGSLPSYPWQREMKECEPPLYLLSNPRHGAMRESFFVANFYLQPNLT